MSAKEVNTEEWEDAVLNSAKPVLVDFWAAWCGPCRAMSRIMDEIADEYEQELDVVKINIDDNPEIARRYNIQSIPFFSRFENGEQIVSAVGARSKVKLISDLMITARLREG